MINEEMISEYLKYQREQERSQATLQKYKNDLNALRVCNGRVSCDSITIIESHDTFYVYLRIYTDSR